jgi:hypothetical protein
VLAVLQAPKLSLAWSGGHTHTFALRSKYEPDGYQQVQSVAPRYRVVEPSTHATQVLPVA